MSRWALGLVETRGLIGSIEAADAAAKAAAVAVSSAELTDAALITVRIEGELGAVQASVEAAVRAAEMVGEVVSVTVIPNPDDGLGIILPQLRYVSKYHPGEDRPPLAPPGDDDMPGPTGPPPSPRRPQGSGGGMGGGRHVGQTDVSGSTGQTPRPDSPKQLKSMTVAELRRFARSLNRLEMSGREISRANKKQLIEAIKRVMDMD
jgi:hypothetical protein